MGIFDSFMPGESYGIPSGGLLGGSYADRLNDPMLQIGLGILANNNSKNFGQVIGRGALQGIQQTQQARRYGEDEKYRQAQMKRYEREDKKDEALEAFHNDFDAKFPQFKGLSRANTPAAMKMAYPDASANASDPYFTDRYIGGKTYAFNNRTGEYIEKDLGGSNLPNKDDPRVQFPVSASKSAGKGLYEVTDKKDGFLMPMTNLAIESGAPPIDYLSQPPTLPQQPQGLPQLPQGNMQPPNQLPYKIMADPSSSPEELAQLQAVAARDYAQNGAGLPQLPQRQPASNRMPTLPQSGGIRVPTKAQEAAAVETAKTQAEFNSPENVMKREQAYTFKTGTGKNMLDKIDEAEKRVSNWTAGFGGSTLKGIPQTDAYDLNADIDTIKANFGFDRLQAMRDMSPTGGALGQVAVQELSALQASVANLDTKQSPAQLKKNLGKAKEHYKNWLDTLEKTKGNGNIMPKDEKMPKTRNRSDILKQYGVTK
jgi:hypothetical protein